MSDQFPLPRVIYLRCCIGVSRSGSSRKGHAVALYDKDQTMVLVVEDLQEQEEWYVSIKTLMEEERKDEEHGERFDEEDDGYCTLPPAAFFKEVRSDFLSHSHSRQGYLGLQLLEMPFTELLIKQKLFSVPFLDLIWRCPFV